MCLERALVTSCHRSALPATQVAVPVRRVRSSKRSRNAPFWYWQASLTHVAGRASNRKGWRHARMRHIMASLQLRRISRETLEQRWEGIRQPISGRCAEGGRSQTQAP